MSLIVSCCLVTSFKKVKSKVRLPNIGLLSDVPAYDTEVFESPSRPRFLAPSRVAGLACCPIHPATSLLTKEACAPVSNRVEALNGGPLSTEMQHIRYDVSMSASSQSHARWVIMASCLCLPPLLSRSRTSSNSTRRLNFLVPSISGALFLATQYMRPPLSASVFALRRALASSGGCVLSRLRPVLREPHTLDVSSTVTEQYVL